jgi:hypothetical protein
MMAVLQIPRKLAPTSETLVIVILTINVGSQDVLDLGGADVPESHSSPKQIVANIIKDNFKPEFNGSGKLLHVCLKVG